MLIAKLLVTAGGLGLMALVAWYFWFSREAGVRAETTAGGRQEVTVVVKAGYDPDVVVVEAGRPVRLNFRREEAAGCSERVVFPAFDKSARLPTGETVSIDLDPPGPGEYEFACQMGMYRGKLVVERA
ncbi:cupredoxin domain-containing protein [Limnochorda pilosa]|uniref:EfeO-type cupredoxin-like domain-containing protein n=1 Tax=Limnochorda pilosa TaxID=1555112 RepID=A0A0K2SQ77_LIMPI|nr:cupredoxin domain-containing protein [Limnochorda pilosa]BAS29283.1 hypothetical protein LIP_3471 [Limnochorda pilosa]